MTAIKNWLNALKSHPVGEFGWQLYQRYDQSNLILLAAALAYYAAFSLGPLVLLLAGWLGVFLRSRPELRLQYQEVLIHLLEQVLPAEIVLQQDSGELVSRSFRIILEQLSEGALLRSAISLVVLLWASSNFFTVLQRALELIFGVPKIRGYLRKRLVALFLVGGVALIILVEVVGGLLASSIGQVLGAVVDGLNGFGVFTLSVPNFAGGFWAELLRTGLATLVFGLCFRYLPKRSSTWPGALAGALFSTSSILVMRWIFERSFNPTQFNLIYGIITSLLIILLWLYFAMLMFLVGALLAAEISARLRPELQPERAPPEGVNPVPE